MGVLDSGTASISADYAHRLRGAIEARCQPQGPLSINRLAAAAGRSRNTLKGWMGGQHDFSLTDLAALDVAAAQLGAGGIYAEVVRLTPQRWQHRRLPLAALHDRKRIRLLQAFEAGDDVLALVGRLGLLDHATLLMPRGNDFISTYVGQKLPVDRSVIGRPLLDRSDRDYAGLVQAQMETTRGMPTLYQLSSDLHSYTRLALPVQGMIVTLPFDSVNRDNWRVTP